MGGRRDAAGQSPGQQIQAAEHEAAKRRILALAEANPPPTGQIDPGEPSWGTRSTAPRVTYEAYLLAVAMTLARRHRPVWSWRRWRRVCRCGADLPCRHRHRLPISRDHWPTRAQQ